MGRYWRTLRRFWGTALATQLEYQANVLKIGRAHV